MTEKYSYLEQYKAERYLESTVEIWCNNVFHPVSAKELAEAETLLENAFPDQIREFYRTIGEGHLTTPHKHEKNYKFHNSNEILPPNVAASFYKGILDCGDDSHYMSEEAYELLSPGDLPFFEIGDSCRYLFMKLNSPNPNAVWALGEIKIEDSFEKFIWHLYYEDPGYYDDIIEAFYR